MYKIFLFSVFGSDSDHHQNPDFLQNPDSTSHHAFSRQGLRAFNFFLSGKQLERRKTDDQNAMCKFRFELLNFTQESAASFMNQEIFR
jgi:hypothetical protein